MRDGLLVLHILAAATWIGGGFYSWYSFTQLSKAGGEAGDSVPRLAATAGRFFGPASGLTLLSGIALVLLVDPWGWSDVFVWVGIGVFVFSAIWQPLVSGKVQTRLLDSLAGGGDTRGAIAGFNRSTAIEMATLVIAVWAMVTKF